SLPRPGSAAAGPPGGRGIRPNGSVCPGSNPAAAPRPNPGGPNRRDPARQPPLRAGAPPHPPTAAESRRTRGDRGPPRLRRSPTASSPASKHAGYPSRSIRCHSNRYVFTAETQRSQRDAREDGNIPPLCLCGSVPLSSHGLVVEERGLGLAASRRSRKATKYARQPPTMKAAPARKIEAKPISTIIRPARPLDIAQATFQLAEPKPASGERKFGGTSSIVKALSIGQVRFVKRVRTT